MKWHGVSFLSPPVIPTPVHISPLLLSFCLPSMIHGPAHSFFLPTLPQPSSCLHLFQSLTIATPPPPHHRLAPPLPVFIHSSPHCSSRPPPSHRISHAFSIPLSFDIFVTLRHHYRQSLVAITRLSLFLPLYCLSHIQALLSTSHSNPASISPQPCLPCLVPLDLKTAAIFLPLDSIGAPSPLYTLPWL
jgi:hypothetical protein